ncbi:DeoR family transcriptional regulator [Thermococcus sp. 18S1]|uniref:AlbA family DNA-binding domain-containing protein n=1 Tax=Thermococcus sp. 18S1 TaxID=1638210 RepID=UPI001439DBC4|nr:helix-turn-helix domain-containing protein [Thermococcus sp. 18S1]NJE31490.1 DeoR family transcriptional regulator [Thermococcus sp. 18S1]
MKICELVERGENDGVEFKENPDIKKILIAVSAFANTHGGLIIIGVRDRDGKVVGVQIGKETLAKLANEIAQNTEPEVIPRLRVEKCGGKDVIVIEIDEHPVKPVMVRGRAYKRVGNSNRKLTPKEISELFEESVGLSWDAYPVDATLDDVDLDKVKEFIRKVKLPSNDEVEALKKLRLIRNGKVTRALILLFGKNPQEFLSQAKVRVGRFRGSEILDSVDIEGNLFEQVEETVNTIKKHMSRRYVIKELVREEVWDYPLEAVREAVVNAVMHRDYRMPEEVQIKVLDDRIIFWNPGGLPVGLSEEDLYREHPSKPRNRLIAEVFHLAGYVEKWGSGTLRILKAFEEAKLPRPEFKEAFGGFQVVFYRDWLTEERLRELGLNERQVKAVLYVKERESITNREYREMFGVSKETAKRDLKELVDAGIFEKTGETGRGVRYILKGSNGS